MKKSITKEQYANLINWAAFLGFKTSETSEDTELSFEGKHHVSGCRISAYIILCKYGNKRPIVFSKCDWQVANEFGYSSACHALKYIEKSLGLEGSK